MAQQIKEGIDRLYLKKKDIAQYIWPDIMPSLALDRMTRALKGTSPIPKELIDYCKKNNIL